MAGRFLRGGLSDLADTSVRLVARPQDDGDLAAMAREAMNGAAEPGRLICSADRERFTLFLPDTISTIGAAARPNVRGFLIDIAVFTRILISFQVDSHLTEAERRVAFQLLAGISLREAATLDGVGLETKRAQIKSATAKMQCSGQIELVRLLMAQLSIVRSLADDDRALLPLQTDT
jgi:DNA-binding CsgD family transcriptional regulator